MSKKTAQDVDITALAFDTLAHLLALMRISAYVLAFYAIGQGILIILGGDGRWSAIAYITASMAPGAPASWGWVLLTCGIFAFTGIKNRMYVVGMVSMGIAGLWSMAFAIAFLSSALKYPEANVTAVAVYGKDAVLFILVALAQRLLARYPKTPEDP